MRFIIFFSLISFVQFSVLADELEQALLLSQQVQNISLYNFNLESLPIHLTDEQSEELQANYDLDRSQDQLYEYLSHPVSYDARYLRAADYSGVQECVECGLTDYKHIREKQSYTVAFTVSGFSKHKNNSGSLSADRQDEVQRFFTELAGATTPEQTSTLLVEAKTTLSFKDKIMLATQLGSLFRQFYNKKRADVDDGTKRTLQDLLAAARAENRDMGGVCRDIATAQAQILHQLGLKNTYVISFASPKVAHTALVTQDPNDPSKIIKINYGDVDTSTARGSSTLSQDQTLPDSGINYYVFDYKGRPVTALPSALGTLLEKQSGKTTMPFTDDNLQHVVTIKSNLIKKGNYTFEARGFAGRVEGESKVFGVMTNQQIRFNNGKYKNTTTLSVGGYQQVIERSKRIVDADALYVRLHSDNDYQLYISKDKKFKISVVGELDAQGIYGVADVTDKEGNTYKNRAALLDGSSKFSGGVEATFQGEKLNAKIKYTQHGFIAAKDVRTYTDVTTKFDYQQLDVAADYAIDEQQARIFAESTVLFDEEFSTRGAGKVGVQKGHSKVHIGYQGAAKSDTPQWLPGAERKFEGGYSTVHKFNGKDLELFLNFDKTKENQNVRTGFAYHF